MKSLILVFFILLSNAVSYSNSVYSPEDIQKLSAIKSKIYFNGESYFSAPLKYPGIIKNSNRNFNDNLAATFTPISGFRNYYDLQSNGTPLQIYVEAANPNNIHAIYTYSFEDSVWNDRTVQYFTSTDKGVTWSFSTNVPSSGRSGFGYLSYITTGAALIACNVNGSPSAQTNFFIDAFLSLL